MASGSSSLAITWLEYLKAVAWERLKRWRLA